MTLYLTLWPEGPLAWIYGPGLSPLCSYNKHNLKDRIDFHTHTPQNIYNTVDTVAIQLSGHPYKVAFECFDLKN